MSAAPAAPSLVDAPILSTLVRLAAPNFIAMGVSTLVAVAETIYVGVLGVPALAGLALVFPLIMLMQMMSAGAMGGGVSSAISRALGAGDAPRAAALAAHAVIIALAAGFVFTIVFLVFERPILVALGGRDAVLIEAETYARMAFAGIACVWLCNILASVLRGTGDMRTPSAVLLLVSALQIAIGGTLGLGLGPVPRLGMTGIALGLVAAFAIGAAIFLVILMTGRARLRLTFDRHALRRDMFLDILKVGAVACASPVMSVATVLILTALVARFGTEALAGYGIGTRLEFMLIPITFAFGVAAVPMVGMAIGAKHVARARQVAWTASLVAGALLGILGLVVALAPSLWSGLFTSEPRVLETARAYLVIAGPTFAFYGFGLCLYFASQGSGRMLGPVAAQGIRLLVVVVGAGLAAHFDWTLEAVFALVAVAFVAYGLANAVTFRATDWNPRGA